MDDLTSFGDVPTPMSNHSDIEFVSEFEGEINTVGYELNSINNDDGVDNVYGVKSLIINYDSKGKQLIATRDKNLVDWKPKTP